MSKEFEAFDHAMKCLLSVPRSEVKRRMEEYQKQARKNPQKRGPKPKRKAVTPSAASDRDAE